MQRMFLLFWFLPFLCKFGFFLDFCPLTNVRISRFWNFENHVFLDQIRLVTPSMNTVLKDKLCGVKSDDPSFTLELAKVKKNFFPHCPAINLTVGNLVICNLSLFPVRIFFLFLMYWLYLFQYYYFQKI